ncbi:MAG: PKD domain-containing protein, partial [Bacteroidota bacterium]
MKTNQWLMILLAVCAMSTAYAQDCVLTTDCGDDVIADWGLANGKTFVCEGEPFEVTVNPQTTMTDIDQIVWIWDDGSVTNAQDFSNQSHIYNLPGDGCSGPNQEVYRITLEITRSCAEGTSCHFQTAPVAVRYKPRAIFDVEPEVCVREAVDFDNNSCNADEYSWAFGDGSTSNLENPSHTYLRAGDYQVTLTVSNECGDNVTVRDVKVVEEPDAEVNVIANPTTGCLPLEVFFENQSQNILGNAISNYEWSVSPRNGWFYKNRIIGNDTTFYNQATWDTQIQFTDTGTYIVELLVENVCGPDTWLDTIRVFEAPNIFLNNPGFQCLDNGSVTVVFDNTLVGYTGTNQGISWVFTDEDGMVVARSNLDNPSITFTEEGTITATVTIDGGPCMEDSDVEVFTIQAPGQVDLSNNPTTLCNTDDPIQLMPAGAAWTGSPHVTINGLLDPSAASGTLNLTYTPVNSDCLSPGTLSIEVLEGPEADIEDIDPVCDEITIAHITAIGGTFGSVSWEHILPDRTIAQTFNQNTAPTITYTGEGEHLLVVKLSDGGCGALTDTSIIEIQRLDSIDITPLPTPLCSTSSPFVLEASPKGGVWTGEGVEQDSIFDPSVPSTGVPITLTYTFEREVCTASESIIVEVLASQAVNIESDVVLCTDSEPYALTADPSGGQWSGTGVSADGVFDPSGLSPGTYDLEYLFVDNNQCEIFKSSVVTVEGLPELEMDDAITFCETDEDIALPLNLIVFDVDPSNGTIQWSGPGIVDAQQGIFNSSQAGASGQGTYTVYIDYSLVACQIRDSLIIEIIPIQTADAGVDTTLCISAATYQLQGDPGPGVWQEINGPGNGLNTTSGLLDLNLAGGGQHTYQYIFGENTSCEVQDEVVIEIIDLSNVSAGRDIRICEGVGSFQLSGSPNNGSWSGPGLLDPNGLFDPSLLTADSTYTLTYCIEDQNIDCTECDELNITIDALPVADFQINGTTCIGEELDIENRSINACTFSWNFGDPLSGAANTSTLETPTHVYNEIGNYTITLIVESCANENCADTTLLSITVEEPPVAAFDTDLEEGCAPLEVAFSNQSSGTNISYLWDFGNGQTSTEQSPPAIVFEQGNFDTTYYINLAVTNACGTVEYLDSVKVFPQPIAIFGTDADDFCSPAEVEISNVSLGKPESYKWYVDGVLVGEDSTLVNQEFTTSDTAITVYTITLVAENFCGDDTLSKQITVFPPDVDAFLSVDTTSGCQPLTVRFSNFSTPGATISWDFGDGNGSSEANTIHTFDTAGIFTVYQFASNCGTDVDSIQIEVFPAPEVSFTHVAYVCVGQDIQFENTSVAITASEWSFGDGATSLLDSPTHIFNEEGDYVVELTGYSSLNNCPASFQSIVTVLGNPDISFVPSSFNGCAPLSIDFENTSVGATFFEWDFGNGEVSSDVSPQNQVFNDPGTYEVTLIGRDTFGCFADTSVVNIIVHEVPEAGFLTNDTEYCSGVDLIETVNTSVGANQYYWTFGAAAQIESFEPSQMVVDTGRLAIELIAENGFGCRDTVRNDVFILATPLAATPTSVYEGCIPLEVSFGNASQFADEFFWDFGENNNTSTEVNPTYSYDLAGNFVATLVAMNSNGCPSDTTTMAITANPLPESAFSLNEEEVCGFRDSIFMNNNSIGATDYVWAFGNGLTSTLFEPFTLYSDTGVYTISLIAQNQFGCLDTARQNLTVLGQPAANILADATDGCQPATFNFVNGSNYSDSFVWNLGDGNVNSTSSNLNHTYLDDGTYTLVLTANNSNNCPSDTDTLTITVHPKPLSNFDLSEELVCGLPDTLETFNFSQGANDYLWDFGNGMSSILTEPSIVYQNPGEYNVSLIVTSAFSCRDTMNQLISVNLQPKVDFGPQQYVGCEPATVNFVNNTLDANGWLWNFGDTISTDLNPTYTYPAAGNYAVELIANYNNLCFDTLSLANAVTVLPSPIASFTFRDSTDGKIQFINRSMDARFYEWDFGNGDFSDEVSPFYEYDFN